MRAPFAPPRRSDPRNVDADAHAVETSSEMDRPDARIVTFKPARSLSEGSEPVGAVIGSYQINSSDGTSEPM